MRILERIMLLLAGLGGIAGFFLPFLRFDHIDSRFDGLIASGWNYVQGGLDMAGVQAFPEGAELLDQILSLWTDTPVDFVKAAIFSFLLIGPVLFVLYSLGYIIKAMIGKQYKRGVFFALLYMGVSALSLFLLGQQEGVSMNFFAIAGLGFWVSFASMILAAFSLIAADPKTLE